MALIPADGRRGSGKSHPAGLTDFPRRGGSETVARSAHSARAEELAAPALRVIPSRRAVEMLYVVVRSAHHVPIGKIRSRLGRRAPTRARSASGSGWFC